MGKLRLIAIVVFFTSLSGFGGGNEVGNGGDRVALEFVSYARGLVPFLKNLNPSDILPLSTFALEKAIETTHVESQEHVYLGTEEVDAINYPTEGKILVNRSRWMEFGGITDLDSRQGLTLHEYLGILHVNDLNYAVSQPLLEKVKRLESSQVPKVRSYQVATILGSPDSQLNFVSRILKKQVPIFDGPFEKDLTTSVYSIFASRGVQSAVAIQTLDSIGTTSETLALKALALASNESAVVMNAAREVDMESQERMCELMSEYANTVFILPARADYSNPDIDGLYAPHCFSSNIVIVAALDATTQTLAAFSDWGAGIRLAAPGVNVSAIGEGGKQGTRSGQVIASAAAAAELAKYAETHPTLLGARLIDHFFADMTSHLQSLDGKIEGGRALLDNSSARDDTADVKVLKTKYVTGFTPSLTMRGWYGGRCFRISEQKNPVPRLLVLGDDQGAMKLVEITTGSSSFPVDYFEKMDPEVLKNPDLSGVSKPLSNFDEPMVG